MMVWMCDRCKTTVKPPNRKNQRPQGWVTLRVTDVEKHVDQWMLCEPCKGNLYAAISS